jgi:hypothetical protein
MTNLRFVLPLLAVSAWGQQNLCNPYLRPLAGKTCYGGHWVSASAYCVAVNTCQSADGLIWMTNGAPIATPIGKIGNVMQGGGVPSTMYSHSVTEDNKNVVTYTPATSGVGGVAGSAGGAGGGSAGPVKRASHMGPLASMPTNCSVGDSFIGTLDSGRQSLYICLKENVWTLTGTHEGEDSESLKMLKLIELHTDFNGVILVCGFIAVEILLAFIYLAVRK